MLKEIVIPDIGTTGEVTVIEVFVKPGDNISVDQPLITLESEKASMEVPSPEAGVVESLRVKLNDKVKMGGVILTLKTSAAEIKSDVPKEAPKLETPKIVESPKTVVTAPEERTGHIYASPLVRRLAREFEIDLSTIVGTGRKSRISREDIIARIKQKQGNHAASSALPRAPEVDFTQFGEIETKPLSKIKKYTAANLHRNWLLVPHVTQFDEVDITLLEDFRKTQAEKGNKLTPLVFIMKAVAAALVDFPQFNASLDATSENLILKKYIHIGVAVDTPEGLVVPVIRDVNKKGLNVLAKELNEVSAKARNKQLLPKDMQGSSFTISSLGGIGGTAFTPIVNLPDVAILGVSKSKIKPVYEESQFVPRLMLPLSLSYDHRVIDGAEGARFIVKLSQYLSDIRLLLI
jgi:pyruvate dehydrogenase E2 component (dihydrolipoamide acetyltransferase)